MVDERRGVGRPTAREIADLLGELRQMLADVGGYATGIPSGRVEAWLTCKADVLTRIAAHDTVARDDTERHDDADRDGRRGGDSPRGGGAASGGAVPAGGRMGDLRWARAACGLSVDAAAQRAVISRSHLSRVERGLCGASPAVLARLTDAYQAGNSGRHDRDNGHAKADQGGDDRDSQDHGGGRGGHGGRVVAAAAMRARARRVAESMPPLTDEQRARLAVLLAPAVTAHARTAPRRGVPDRQSRTVPAVAQPADRPQWQ